MTNEFKSSITAIVELPLSNDPPPIPDPVLGALQLAVE
jgi:hypothetical protein